MEVGLVCAFCNRVKIVLNLLLSSLTLHSRFVEIVGVSTRILHQETPVQLPYQSRHALPPSKRLHTPMRLPLACCDAARTTTTLYFDNQAM